MDLIEKQKEKQIQKKTRTDVIMSFSIFNQKNKMSK